MIQSSRELTNMGCQRNGDIVLKGVNGVCKESVVRMIKQHDANGGQVD